jgi:hypothetical protein
MAANFAYQCSPGRDLSPSLPPIETLDRGYRINFNPNWISSLTSACDVLPFGTATECGIAQDRTAEPSSTMAKWQFTKGLHELGKVCCAYLQPDGMWGYSNAGLILHQEETLLVDTLVDFKRTRQMPESMLVAVPAAEKIGALLNTHSNPDPTNRNQLVVGARIISSTACRDEMQEQATRPRQSAR